MKLLLSWNLWNNFQDLEIASEIVHKLNADFQNLDILQISQSGYKDYNGNVNLSFIDKHFVLNVDESHPIAQLHVKYLGMMRIFNSLINAYDYALKNNCEYFLSTHSDAWIFDLNPIYTLLNADKIKNNAVFCRMGINASIDNSFSEFIPFYDDHFLIFNTKECQRLNVFENNFDYLFNSIFLNFGGIHYLLKVFFDKKVPTDKLYVYSNLLNCVNHYNDLSGYNLIPLQYDDKYHFLHANCEQWKPLHALRIKYLEMYKLDNIESAIKYKEMWKHLLSDFTILSKGNHIYFKEKLVRKAYVFISILSFKIKGYLDFYYYRSYVLKKNKLKSYKYGSLYYFNLIKHIKPLGITQRK